MPNVWELPGREMDPKGKFVFPSLIFPTKSAAFVNASDISGPVQLRYARIDPCTCVPTLVLSRSPSQRTFGQGEADANRHTLAKDATCVS